MPVATVKQLCPPSSLVTSDSLVEQVAQIEDFAAAKIDGSEFFRRNYFTDGLRRLVQRGFERLAGRPMTVLSISPRPWAAARRIA